MTSVVGYSHECICPWNIYKDALPKLYNNFLFFFIYLLRRFLLHFKVLWSFPVIFNMCSTNAMWAELYKSRRCKHTCTQTRLVKAKKFKLFMLLLLCNFVPLSWGHVPAPPWVVHTMKSHWIGTVRYVMRETRVSVKVWMVSNLLGNDERSFWTHSSDFSDSVFIVTSVLGMYVQYVNGKKK